MHIVNSSRPENGDSQSGNNPVVPMVGGAQLEPMLGRRSRDQGVGYFFWIPLLTYYSMSMTLTTMNELALKRHSSGFSQRVLANKAGVSFRCLQQLESKSHNWRVDSLRLVGRALDLPDGGLDYFCARYLSIAPSSVEDVSLRIHHDGPESWKIHLFDFVDRFRVSKDMRLIERPPVEELTTPLRALLASTVEMLSAETGITTPDWCRSIPRLNHPWFVSGMENLKAMSLVESPAPYRARNIFVLANFLDRA